MGHRLRSSQHGTWWNAGVWGSPALPSWSSQSWRRGGGFPHTPGPSAEGCSEVSSLLLARGGGAAAVLAGLSSLLCPGFSLVYAG